MMKCIILSFLVCASAIRLQQVHEEVAEDTCDPLIKAIFQKHAVNNTVVFTGIDLKDGDYDEMIQNYACNVRRAGLPLLVWSMTEATHAKIAEFGYPDVYQPQQPKFIKPMSTDYKKIVYSKPTQIKYVVNCGFNALWLDADIGIAQNPLPYFEAHQGDLQVSTNYPQPAIHTGVVYVRKTLQTTALMNEWDKVGDGSHLPWCAPWCTDQDALSHVVNASCGVRVHGKDFFVEDRETNAVTCNFVNFKEGSGSMNIDLLPPGKFTDARSGKFADEWFTFHPNFSGLNGQMETKKKMMKRHGLHGKNMWCLKDKNEDAAKTQ